MAWNLACEARNSRTRSATDSAMVLNAAASWPTSSSDSTATRADRSPPAMASPAAVSRRRWRVSHSPRASCSTMEIAIAAAAIIRLPCSRPARADSRNVGRYGEAQHAVALTVHRDRQFGVEAPVGAERSGRHDLLDRRQGLRGIPSVGGDQTALVVHQNQVTQAVLGAARAQDVLQRSRVAVDERRGQRSIEHGSDQARAQACLLDQGVLHQPHAVGGQRCQHDHEQQHAGENELGVQRAAGQRFHRRLASSERRRTGGRPGAPHGAAAAGAQLHAELLKCGHLDIGANRRGLEQSPVLTVAISSKAP